MGHMKRAEERERLARLRAGTTERVIITWRRQQGEWLVNFLDPRSRLPISYQRVYADAETIRGLVARSLTNPRGGPKLLLFTRALAAGQGEIEIELSHQQYVQLTTSKPKP